MLIGAAAGAQGPSAGSEGPAQPAARRVALVIGNNAYEAAPLVNSVNDARAMAGALRDAGFTVLLHTDVDLRQMNAALRDFGERLKAGSGGVGLFYFAGHGMQIKGRNFLIPVRSDIAHEDEVSYQSLDTQAVLDKMESAGNGTNIVILDACRNNPFTRTFRSAQQGLAQMDAPVGTLISFATAPGALAIDNLPGLRNGLFTTHLLEAVRRRGLKVEDVLKQVRAGVLRASNNRQMPWESSALVGDFYFHPPAHDAAAPVPASALSAADRQASADDALWDALKDSTEAAGLFAYLHRFPSGRHAGEARRRLLAFHTSADASSLSTPPDAAETAERLRAASARLQRDLGASLALTRQKAQERDTWGTLDVFPPRAPTPPRNAHGFAVGDRFRYRLTDLRGTPYSRHYAWHVDRIDGDGGVWINGGRQRLDAVGARRGGNDEMTGTWLDFAPPLPLATALAQGPGHQGPVSTVLSERDAAGRTTKTELDGVWRTTIDEVPGPRHHADTLTALLVEVQLFGTRPAGEGGSRQSVLLQHRYWLVPELLLPVRMMIEEKVDGQLVQRSRHELVAVDVLSPEERATARLVK